MYICERVTNEKQWKLTVQVIKVWKNEYTYKQTEISLLYANYLKMILRYMTSNKTLKLTYKLIYTTKWSISIDSLWYIKNS